jgi:RNA polymerase sigma-70 factor (ECF subfamily)
VALQIALRSRRPARKEGIEEPGMTATPSTPTPDDLARACARHEAYLRARLRGLGVADATLDDAVQDVFEVLVRRLGDYDSRFSLRQWMAGVARRIARRHRERASRAPEPIDDDALASGALDPERWTSRQEALTVLRGFLGQLDADRWAVFVLSEIEGLRGTEIAAELDVNLSTVYARLRVARQAFERVVSQHRRRERHSWLILPFFGPKPAGQTGTLAFTTPVLLVTLGAAGLGGALAMSDCGAAAPAPDPAVHRPVAEPTSAAPVSGIQAREADPPTVATALHSTPSGSLYPAEQDGWIAAGYGLTRRGGPNFYSEPHYRLEGSDLVFRIEYIGDDDVATQAHAGWVELDGFVVIDGSDQWPLDLAAGERRFVTVRLRAARNGPVEVRLRDGDPQRTYGSGTNIRLFHEPGGLRPCRRRECTRALPSVQDMLSGTRITVDLHNTCDRAIDVVMLPMSLDEPPPDAPSVRLARGERRSMSVDTALGFSRRTEDGHLAARVQTDTEGAIIRFAGDGCAEVGAFDPKLPPALLDLP